MVGCIERWICKTIKNIKCQFGFHSDGYFDMSNAYLMCYNVMIPYKCGNCKKILTVAEMSKNMMRFISPNEEMG